MVDCQNPNDEPVESVPSCGSVDCADSYNNCKVDANAMCSQLDTMLLNEAINVKNAYSSDCGYYFGVNNEYCKEQCRTLVRTSWWNSSLSYCNAHTEDYYMPLVNEYCATDTQKATDNAIACSDLKSYMSCDMANCPGEENWVKDACQFECAVPYTDCVFDASCWNEYILISRSLYEHGINPNSWSHVYYNAFTQYIGEFLIADYCDANSCSAMTTTLTDCQMNKCINSGSDCLETSCSTQLQTCLDDPLCIEAMMQTQDALYSDYQGDTSTGSRRRLSIFLAEADKSVSTTAQYMLAWYNRNCGENCNGNWQTLLSCAQDNCDVDHPNSICLDDDCQQVYSDCLADDRCFAEIEEYEHFVVGCNRDRETRERPPACNEYWDTIASASYPSQTVYPQYECWDADGCSPLYQELFTCAGSCLIEIEVEDALPYVDWTECFDNCDGVVSACLFDQDCFTALIQTTEMNGTAFEMWIENEVLSGSVDVSTSNAFIDFVNDEVCDQQDVVCNELYYDVVRCIWDDCLSIVTPCSFQCSQEIFDCVETVESSLCSTQATAALGFDLSFDMEASDSFQNWLSTEKPLNEYTAPDYKMLDDKIFGFPAEKNEQTAADWETEMYTNGCGEKALCSTKYKNLVNCLSDVCIYSESSSGDGDTDGNADGNGDDGSTSEEPENHDADSVFETRRSIAIVMAFILFTFVF
jgi:hypothetical protein